VPALLCQGEQPAFGHFGEMTARGLRRDAPGKGELGRSQGAAVEQRRQHVGASGIADERGDFGERWLNWFHAGKLSPRHHDVIARYYGIGRIDRVGSPAKWATHRHQEQRTCSP
jgi:hypothetical protein